MTTAERERITDLGRRKGEELLATGLLERKAGVLRTLGWPEAVRQARNHKRAS